jgi:hypothetical protein
MNRLHNTLIYTTALTVILLSAAYGQAQEPNAMEARTIAKEAYIYGYPLVTMVGLRRGTVAVVKEQTGNVWYCGSFSHPSAKNRDRDR